MTTLPTPEPARGVSRRRLLQGAAGGLLASRLGLRPATASAADDFCSHPNPIVRENRCTSTWTDEFQLSNFDGLVLGFALKTAYDVGEAVQLKLVSYDGAATTARLRVYRLGHYGGYGGRLVHERTAVPLPSGGAQGAATEQPQFGLVSCASFPVVTDLGFAPTVSGVYLVKIVANTGAQNHVVFVVRDDARPRDLLVVMPTNSWQAYNNWGGKSFYFYNSNGPGIGGGATTDAGVNGGRSRAVKVSFDRPHLNANSDYNWVLRCEFPLIAWLERQGYDIAYTDDHGLDSQPEQLLPAQTKTVVIAGHSEYWTKEMRDNVQAARDAGTNIASFSANTAYWQVRYEDAGRTMVCFKTSEGNITTGTAGVNDYGPGATARGGPSDPLGPDQVADTADDKPQFATTTFRDRGAGQEPATGRVAIHRPENALFGVLFIGDDDSVSRGLGIPAGSGSGGEFGAHPAWRHTDVGTGGVVIGADLVGWEWDAIPPDSALYQEALAAQPAGVKRVAETVLDYNPKPTGSAIEFLQDDGRVYIGTPPAGLPALAHAVTYETAGGALVFAAGTMQWSWGLAPHYLPAFTNTYMDPPVDSSDSRIQQATYNILADGGTTPDTPEGIVIDTGEPAPPGTPPTAGPPPTGPPGPAPDRSGPILKISDRVPSVGDAHTARVRISCPATELRGAEGMLMLTSVKTYAPGRGSRGKKRRLKLGSKGFQVLGGHSVDVEVRLSRRGLSLLRRAGSMKVAATVVARDAAGNAATTKRRLVLHSARKRSKR